MNNWYVTEQAINHWNDEARQIAGETRRVRAEASSRPQLTGMGLSARRNKVRVGRLLIMW